MFVGVGMMVASFQYGAVQHPAQATVSDNVMGWIWADPIGWSSMNDTNAGACSPGPCGSYGVNVDPNTRNMNGFAWNDGAGWICFGDSCSACGGFSSPGSASAYLNPVSGVTDVHGWAKVCNEGDAGYVSLNCTDPSACGIYAYKVQYDPTTKKFTANTPPPYTSFAWNGNSDGTGFGYIDFSSVYLNTPGESACTDGKDNDLNGKIDCQDSACQSTAACQEIPTNTDSGGNNMCHNGVDDNGDGLIDCAAAACQPSSYCNEVPGVTDAGGTPLCGNGKDDNGNGLIDCADPGCAGYVGPPGASCSPPPPPAGSEPSCTDPNPPFAPLGVHACCSNSIDDDGNGTVDCNDASCQAVDPTCAPPWLQTQYGSIYAQQGLVASSSPLLTTNNATYCLTTEGSITGFTSAKGCSETGAQKIQLPSGAQQYQGTLGSLDIYGILAGHYGAVVNFTGSLPTLLGGKVYHAVGPGTITLNAAALGNGSAQTDRGNGLLIIEGADLHITGNITYAPSASIQYLRNLASLGIIVTKKNGFGGNIVIDPGVTIVSAAMFAEESIKTGTACGGATTCPSEQPLTVYGLMAAHQIDLQRVVRDPSTPAENVIFDGRAVANPPPGMADVSKSLPATQDAF